MITGVVCEKILNLHVDGRRALTSIFNMDVAGFAGAKQVKVLEAKTDFPLGRHEHAYAELFSVLSGEAVFSLKVQSTGVEETHILVPGWRLLVPANVWHEARMKPGSVLLGLTEEPFVSQAKNYL